MNKGVLFHLNAVLFAVMLSMSYYLLPLLGISQLFFFILLISVVSFSIVVANNFLKRFNYLEYLILLLIVLSLVLYIIHVDLYTKPFFNDLIRLFCFFLFLRYLRSLQIFEIKYFFKIFATYSILCVFPILFFEFNFHSEYRLLLSVLFDSDYIANMVNSRLAGLIGDSNALSFLLVIIALIISDSDYNILIKSMIIFIIVVSIFFTGSRMGLLMLILLLLRIFGVYRTALFSVLATFIIFLVFEPLEFRDASDSDSDRIDSILSGWNYLLNSDFIFPLGNVLYKNNYLNLSLAEHYPHLGILYLLTEYGLFCLPIFILVFFVYRRLLRFDLYLFLILIIALLLLPNQIYYFTFYLAFGYNLIYGQELRAIEYFKRELS